MHGHGRSSALTSTRAQVRQALEVHARGIGSSIPDLLRGLSPAHASDAAAAPPSAASPTPDHGSDHLTPSRHASLLCALTGADAVADTGCAAAEPPPSSPQPERDPASAGPDAVRCVLWAVFCVL